MEGKASDKFAVYGKVSNKFAEAVYNVSEQKMDISGCYLELSANDLRHAYDKHKQAVEEGDVEMSFSDFVYAIKNINNGIVEKAATRKNGENKITVSIKRGQGRIIAIELFSKSAGSVRMKTGWAVSEEKYLEKFKSSPNSAGNESSTNTARFGTASINNIPQNEEKVTKKYSINVDDTLFDTLSDTYSEQEQGDASIVQQGFESLKNVTVDERMISKIAYAIKKEYQSTYSKEKLTENLTRVFAYLKDTKNVQYEDMVRIMREVAKPVLEESTDINDYEKQMYDDFRNYFKGKTILLNKEQRAEVEHYYGSLDTFRKMNFGKITFAGDGFAKKGIKLDSIWSEICDKSYQMLDYDASVADQPILLMDLMNELKPVKRNIYGMNVDEAAYDLALDIFRRFFVEQAQEAANQKVNAKTVRLTERQQEFRRNVNKEYRAKVEQIRESEAKRRERLKAYYEDKLEDAKRSKEAALEHKDKQAAEMYAKQADQYVKLLGKLKQSNDTIIKIKAAQRQDTIDRRRKGDIRKRIERVKKNAKSIITYFNTNTDKKHVPEALKDTIAEFITSLDFFGHRAGQNSKEQQAWQASLNKLYLQLSSYSSAVEGGYEEVYNALFDRNNGDEKVSSLLNDIQSFLLANDKVQISKMGYAELQQLDEIMTALKRAITTVNQLYVNKRTSNVEQLGNGTISELSNKNDKKLTANKGMEQIDSLLNVKMLDARSYFYRLGERSVDL